MDEAAPTQTVWQRRFILGVVGLAVFYGLFMIGDILFGWTRNIHRLPALPDWEVEVLQEPFFPGLLGFPHTGTFIFTPVEQAARDYEGFSLVAACEALVAAKLGRADEAQMITIVAQNQRSVIGIDTSGFRQGFFTQDAGLCTPLEVPQ